MYFSKITAAAPGSICFQQRAEAAVYSITKEINASEASTKHGGLSHWVSDNLSCSQGKVHSF